MVLGLAGGVKHPSVFSYIHSINEAFREREFAVVAGVLRRGNFDVELAIDGERAAHTLRLRDP